MEKKEFISLLRKSLLERGFDPETVDAEMIPVSAYFDENGMKDIRIPVSEMADEITDMLRERDDGQEDAPAKEENAGAPAAEPSGNFAVDDIEAALLASGADLSAPDSGAPEAPAETVPAEEDPDDADAAADEGEYYSADAEDSNIEDYRPGSDRTDVEKAGFIGKLIVKFKNAVKKKEPVDEDYPEEEKTDYEDGKHRVLFWVLFAIAIPFLLALALLIIMIYVAFWVVLALIMIVFVTGLIAFTFAGALISLIGIIYGVIMIIKGATPVGLFEIGLGVTVGAVVMFVGILVYNFAIRLIPFAMKMLAKLLFFALRRGKEGIGAIRRLLRTV